MLREGVDRVFRPESVSRGHQHARHAGDHQLAAERVREFHGTR